MEFMEFTLFTYQADIWTY